MPHSWQVSPSPFIQPVASMHTVGAWVGPGVVGVPVVGAGVGSRVVGAGVGSEVVGAAVGWFVTATVGDRVCAVHSGKHCLHWIAPPARDVRNVSTTWKVSPQNAGRNRSYSCQTWMLESYSAAKKRPRFTLLHEPQLPTKSGSLVSESVISVNG